MSVHKHKHIKLDHGKIVDHVLKVLRNQRDNKQVQEIHDTYDINPQVFQSGTHYVAGPIRFKNPFNLTPSITFGGIAQKAIEDTTMVNQPLASGYIPSIVHPYVYGFQQSSGLTTGFFLGLYLLTPMTTSTTKFTISWHAKGKGSAYPQHRTQEAWSTAYNKNEAGYMTNDQTGIR